MHLPPLPSLAQLAQCSRCCSIPRQPLNPNQPHLATPPPPPLQMAPKRKREQDAVDLEVNFRNRKQEYPGLFWYFGGEGWAEGVGPGRQASTSCMAGGSRRPQGSASCCLHRLAILSHPLNFPAPSFVPSEPSLHPPTLLQATSRETATSPSAPTGTARSGAGSWRTCASSRARAPRSATTTRPPAPRPRQWTACP